MGADSFHVCYGLRWEVDADDEPEVTLLERRQDPRQLAAQKHKLDSWWGVATDQQHYFILVGKLIGNFGWEGDHAKSLQDADLTRLVEKTKLKLAAAGFNASPAWHCQFEPDC